MERFFLLVISGAILQLMAPPVAKKKRAIIYENGRCPAVSLEKYIQLDESDNLI